MTVSIVECSKCHRRFNYEWSKGASWSSIPLGNRSIFKCPICKELGSFNLTHEGRDPALPTTNDMQAGLGGRIWGLMLGPFLGLVAIGVVLNMALAVSPLVPILGGIAWLMAFVYFLNRKVASRGNVIAAQSAIQP